MLELLVVDAGTVPYAEAYEWQKDLHRRRVANEVSNTVLLIEHPHTYTLGRRFSKEHLLFDEEVLRERGIEVHEADRGGSITYHGPGQLVAYPILDLRKPGVEFPDAILYLRKLEEAILRTVRSFGVMASRREGLTGVWVGHNKLAAIGVNVSSGVTKHGLAINVNTDLTYFDGMVACGIQGSGVTSMREALGAVEIDAVKLRLSKELGRILHLRPVPADLPDIGLARPGQRADEAEVVDFRRKAV